MCQRGNYVWSFKGGHLAVTYGNNKALLLRARNKLHLCACRQTHYSIFCANLCTEASAAECTWSFKAAKTPSTLSAGAQAYAEKLRFMLLASESWAPRRLKEQALGEVR